MERFEGSFLFYNKLKLCNLDGTDVVNEHFRQKDVVIIRSTRNVLNTLNYDVIMLMMTVQC